MGRLRAKEKPKAKRGKNVKASAGGKEDSAAAADADTEPAGRIKQKGKKGRNGWSSSGQDIEVELAALGLRIKQITADGNCFFRSLGDQVAGDEGLHSSLRAKIITYMREHEEEFRPFVEDDETLEKYLSRQKKDGVWAGNMELVAAARCLDVNITVYQAGQPRWTVGCDASAPSTRVPPMLHISYHDGQHYNSVRMGDDMQPGPPKPIQITGSGLIITRAAAAADGDWGEREVLRVATSTACDDLPLVRQALKQAFGDIDLAIEKVIEQLAAEDGPGPETAPMVPADSNALHRMPISNLRPVNPVPSLSLQDEGTCLEPGGGLLQTPAVITQCGCSARMLDEPHSCPIVPTVAQRGDQTELIMGRSIPVGSHGGGEEMAGQGSKEAVAVHVIKKTAGPDLGNTGSGVVADCETVGVSRQATGLNNGQGPPGEGAAGIVNKVLAGGESQAALHREENADQQQASLGECSGRPAATASGTGMTGSSSITASSSPATIANGPANTASNPANTAGGLTAPVSGPSDNSSDSSSQGSPLPPVITASKTAGDQTSATSITAQHGSAAGSAPVGKDLMAKPQAGRVSKAGVRVAIPSFPKPPARNKSCPCGSKKKHKNCCGSASSSAARHAAETGTNTSASGGSVAAGKGLHLAAQISAIQI